MGHAPYQPAQQRQSQQSLLEWPTHNASRTSSEPLLAVAESEAPPGIRGVFAHQLLNFAKISVTKMPLVLAMFHNQTTTTEAANTLPLRRAMRSVAHTMLGASVRSPRDQEELPIRDAM